MKFNHPASTFLSGLLLALSIFLTLGTQFLFPACGAGENGGYMLCHWAQQATTGAAGVLVLLHIFLLLSRDQKSKTAFLVASVPVTVLAMLFPGTLISMCMSADMRCRAVMHPAVLAVGGVILAVTVIALLVNLRKER